MERDLIPSDAYPNALAAVEHLSQDAASISVAVAFVTEAGVKLLGEILATNPEVDVSLVARAADVTSPAALVELSEELHVSVSVVIGRNASAFHPKLWLFRTETELRVLSGSGNLTQAGLLDNDEQFEVLRMPSTSEEARSHESRFIVLTARGLNLAEVRNHPVWDEWLSVRNKQKHHRSELKKLGAQLAAREVRLGRDKDKGRLLADLDDLYDATVDANIPRADGQQYFPTRFKQGIDRARDGGDPVVLVTRMCRRQTEGFDVILNADKPELTVEALVLDETKPYHDLFRPATLQLSAERLRQFPSWSGL